MVSALWRLVSDEKHTMYWTEFWALRVGPSLSHHRRPVLTAIILGHIAPSLCQEPFMTKELKKY